MLPGPFLINFWLDGSVQTVDINWLPTESWIGVLLSTEFPVIVTSPLVTDVVGVKVSYIIRGPVVGAGSPDGPPMNASGVPTCASVGPEEK